VLFRSIIWKQKGKDQKNLEGSGMEKLGAVDIEVAEADHDFYFDGSQGWQTDGESTDGSDDDDDDDTHRIEMDSLDEEEGIFLREGTTLNDLISHRVAIDQGEQTTLSNFIPISAALHSHSKDLKPLCGRIYSIYRAEIKGSPKQIAFIGSGFKISPSLICTADHCISATKKSDSFPDVEFAYFCSYIFFVSSTTQIRSNTFKDDRVRVQIKASSGKKDFCNPL